MENARCVLVMGAGASVADCTRLRPVLRPPVDKGFFRAAYGNSQNEMELKRIATYLRDNYAVASLTDSAHDSLEGIMVRLYTDLFHPSLGDRAYTAFLGLLQVFNRQLATTTNGVSMGPRKLLYKVIKRHLDLCGTAGNLTIITFNQDIQIEKALSEIDARSSKKVGQVFSFPHLYGLGDVDVTSVSGQPVFAKSARPDSSVSLLKLHGSLNWYWTSIRSKPSKSALFKTDRKLAVTSRKIIAPEMRRRADAKRKRSMNTFPIVVPPVNHKAAILHESLMPLWDSAEQALTNATHVTILGYSCPPADFESANLISRSFNKNTVCENLTVIDPQPSVLMRFVELTGMDSVTYFRSAKRFLEVSAALAAQQKRVSATRPVRTMKVA